MLEPVTITSTQSRVIRWRRYFPVLAAFLIGLAFTGMLGYVVDTWHVSRMRTRFHDTSIRATESIMDNFETNQDFLFTLRDFYAANDGIIRHEFEVFSREAIARQPELQNLMWIKPVRDMDRDRFRKHVQAEGYPEFKITQIDSRGATVPAARRDEYLVTVYVEPLEKNLRRFGLDHTSLSERLPAIRKACSTGTVAMTPPVKLVQEGTNSRGVTLYLPIYDMNPEHGDTAPEKPAAFAAISLALGEFVERSLRPLQPTGIDLRLFDVDAPSNDSQLWPSHQNVGAGASSGAERLGLSYDVTFTAADRQWRIHCEPNAAFIAESATWLPFGVTLTGLAATLALCLLIFIPIRRNTQVEVLLEDLSREVMEHQRTEATLRETNQKLEEFIRLRREFLGAAAHELRTPTAILMGAVDLLRRGKVSDLPPVLTDIFAVIERSVARLSRLINKLLDVSFIEMGQMKISRERIDLRQPISQGLESMALLVARTKISLDIEQSPDPIWIHADADRIGQITTNIVENALRFARQRVVVRVEKRGAEAVVTFEDDGPGVAPADLPLLFERFTRTSTPDAASHLGFGLMIVKSIVDGHAGSITAENRAAPDTGLHITMRLPLAEEESPVSASW